MSIRTFLMSLTVMLALAGTATAQSSTPFSWNFGSGGGGGASSPTTPGGTVTGAIQYRSAGGTFAGDDLMVTNGSGIITLAGVSSTGTVSSSMFRGLGGSSANVTFGLQGMNNIGLYFPTTSIARISVLGDGFQFGSAFNSSIRNLGINGTFTPGTTLHVSGTSILGIANASISCGASQLGAVVYSNALSTLAACNGSGSWIPMVSGSLVSASAL